MRLRALLRPTRSSSAILAIVLGASVGAAQPATPEGRTPWPIPPAGLESCPRPARTPEVPDRLVGKAMAATLQKAFDTALAESGANPKGLSVAVLIPGQGYWTAQLGTAGNHQRITAATRFHAGSSGKLITAALVATAVVEHRLDLAAHLEPTLGIPEAWQAIELGELLNHTGGLGSFEENPHYDRRAPTPPAELIALTPSALDCPPGTAYRYSNTGYILLGLALVRTYGQPWSEQVRTRLFDQLPGCIALTAEQCRDGDLAVGFHAGRPLPCLADYRNVFSCGGIIARPLDLARLYETILQGRTISEPAAALLRDDMVQTADTAVAVWAGRGIDHVETPKGGFLLHGGAIPGFRCMAGLALESGVAAAVMTNDDSFIPDPVFFRLCLAATQASCDAVPAAK